MMDWQDCCNKFVKEVKADKPMIHSLIISSKNKFLSEQQLKLSDITAASKVILAYDSVRELLEAIALEQGYKVYNHECYGAFIAEILHLSMLAQEFDSLRKVRNAIDYYGKEISKIEADDIITRIYEVRKNFLKDTTR